MTPEQFVAWLPTAGLTAFAVVLWWLARKLWTRLDHQDMKTDNIQHMLTTELRGLDVRLSVLEAQLNQLRK